MQRRRQQRRAQRTRRRRRPNVTSADRSRTSSAKNTRCARRTLTQAGFRRRRSLRQPRARITARSSRRRRLPAQVPQGIDRHAHAVGVRRGSRHGGHDAGRCSARRSRLRIRRRAIATTRRRPARAAKSSERDPAGRHHARPGSAVMLIVNGTAAAVACASALRILGIDPALRTTGYGVDRTRNGRVRLVEAGVVAPRVDAHARASGCASSTPASPKSSPQTQPELVVIEELYTTYRNPRDGGPDGARARRALLGGGAGRRRGPYLGHARVKRALVGSGSARKDAGQRDGHAACCGLRARPKPTTFPTRWRSRWRSSTSATNLALTVARCSLASPVRWSSAAPNARSSRPAGSVTRSFFRRASRRRFPATPGDARHARDLLRRSTSTATAAALRITALPTRSSASSSRRCLPSHRSVRARRRAPSRSRCRRSPARSTAATTPS